MTATRPVTDGEQHLVDADETAPFGTYAPNLFQRALISASQGSFLRRGVFRKTMARLIMGSGAGLLDISFRGCNYRLRGLNNLIEYGLLLNPDYNSDDIDFLAANLPSGGVFVDIGANVGLYTQPLARHAGPSGKVVAIDANPLMARRLAWNVNASSLANVSIFQCAVSDHEGAGRLAIRKDDIAIVSLEDDEVGSVPVRRLESVLAEAGIDQVDCLKIDIEGHEEKVLPAFIDAATDAMLPKGIVIERPPGGVDYPLCAAAFARRGYRPVGRSRNNTFFQR
jgi:FkbM family methyltransferase